MAFAALSLSAVADVPRRPSNPLNITVVNLRPITMSTDISQTDTADIVGDTFFYLADKLVLAY